MNAPTPAETSAVGAVAVWARYGLIAVAWPFAAGAVVQIFLAGLFSFDDPSYRADHVDFGRMIGFLTYLLPILALIGRVGVPRFMHALVIALLFVVQQVLANVDEGYIAALHPVNGILLLGGSFDLGMRSLGLVRSRRGRRSDGPPLAA